MHWTHKLIEEKWTCFDVGRWGNSTKGLNQGHDL